MKCITVSLLSAVLASLLTAMWLAPSSRGTAVAQEIPPGGGPQLASPVTPRNTRYFDGSGLTSEEAVNVAVYDNANRAVVHITTKTSRPDGFFLLDVPAEGSGSGVILDTRGHILTNFHVVEEAQQVEVYLHDGKNYDATFVGADSVNDIAVIKIDAPEDVLAPVQLGDSAGLRVGMRVYAIGNPFGLERTMTTGIISSLNRSLQIRGNRTIKSIIQIDAAVNPGNSGGPLLDAHGRLIGINTAIASRTGQSSGVGFAIPVNLIARVVPQLIDHGRVIRPETGIQQVYQTDEGLLVARVTPKGPAEQAGLRGPNLVRKRRGPFVVERLDRSTADLIVAVNGEKVKTADEFLSFVEAHAPGDQITLTVVREGQRIDVRMVLGGEQEPPAE